jgi:hypothetical protein
MSQGSEEVTPPVPEVSSEVSINEGNSREQNPTVSWDNIPHEERMRLYRDVRF